MPLVYPPTFCTTIVIASSQDINRNTQEKLEMMVMQFFFFFCGGGGGRYIMVYVKWLVQKIHQSLSLSWSCLGEEVFENIIKNYCKMQYWG